MIIFLVAGLLILALLVLGILLFLHNTKNTGGYEDGPE
jgi:hypothetical protein